jgi:sugar (pentulose or hexulose) kinase
VGTGERFPFVESRATSFIVPGPDDVERDSLGIFSSIALGVALIERLCLDVVSHAGYTVAGPVSLTGGASTNREWNQLRATVLNRHCEVPLIKDSAFGMAILARAGIEAKGSKDFETIVESMVAPGDTFGPETELREIVDEKYVVLLDELRQRKWITPELSEYAKANSS